STPSLLSSMKRTRTPILNTQQTRNQSLTMKSLHLPMKSSKPTPVFLPSSTFI
ncbi:hypothetical protein SNEBB_003730, partial [Seison nebaliae]